MLSKMATPVTQAHSRFRYGKSRRTVAVMCVPDKEKHTISERIAKMEIAMGCKIKIKGMCTVMGKKKESDVRLSDATDKSEGRKEKSNNDDNEDVVRFSGVPFEAETCATEQITVGGDKKSSLLRFVQVGRDIGYGTSSRVYLAIDAENLQTVAVKEVCLARKSKKAKVEAELQVLQLHVNPNVDAASKHLVKYFGTATSPHRDTYSFVVEHMMHGSLRTWMDRAIEEDTSLPMEWITSLSKDIMLGLDHLHSRLAITHADIIKPENILISENGRAVIADFGIAYALGLSTDDKNSKASKHAKKSLSNGTFHYTSPERLIGNCSRLEASDVWSAGKTLFDCVTRAGTASSRGCTYWHILRTAEGMKENVQKSEVVPAKMASFLSLCFESEDLRPSAARLLHDEFLSSVEWTKADWSNTVQKWWPQERKLSSEEIKKVARAVVEYRTSDPKKRFDSCNLRPLVNALHLSSQEVMTAFADALNELRGTE